MENNPADDASQITGLSLKNTILQKMKDLPPMLQTVVKARKMLAVGFGSRSLAALVNPAAAAEAFIAGLLHDAVKLC